jgi:protein-tyrosine-phosphatase
MSETKTLLILCTGNYYRSRYAEIVFNARAQEEQLPWQAISPRLTASSNAASRKVYEKSNGSVGLSAVFP